MADPNTLIVTPSDDDLTDAFGNTKKPPADGSTVAAPATAAPMATIKPPTSSADLTSGNDAPTAFQRFITQQSNRPDPWAPKIPQPITSSTPTSVLQRAVGNTAWNFQPGQSPGDGNIYADSAGGAPAIHADDGTFLRPSTGPQSLRSFLQRPPAPVANPAPANFAGVTGSATSQPVSSALPAIDPSSNPVSQFSMPATRIPGGAASATAASNTPQIDSGVTVGGRHLNYGAMVNG
ncbi:MAG: hypothetical protein WA777_12640, partial [Rhodanobacter sp.]